MKRPRFSPLERAVILTGFLVMVMGVVCILLGRGVIKIA